MQDDNTVKTLFLEKILSSSHINKYYWNDSLDKDQKQSKIPKQNQRFVLIPFILHMLKAYNQLSDSLSIYTSWYQRIRRRKSS